MVVQDIFHDDNIIKTQREEEEEEVPPVVVEEVVEDSYVDQVSKSISDFGDESLTEK